MRLSCCLFRYLASDATCRTSLEKTGFFPRADQVLGPLCEQGGAHRKGFHKSR